MEESALMAAMTPRVAVSFKDAETIWEAVFAWRASQNADAESLAILDAVGALVLAEREACAQIAERYMRIVWEGAPPSVAQDLPTAIRARRMTK